MLRAVDTFDHKMPTMDDHTFDRLAVYVRNANNHLQEASLDLDEVTRTLEVTLRNARAANEMPRPSTVPPSAAPMEPTRGPRENDDTISSEPTRRPRENDDTIASSPRRPRETDAPDSAILERGRLDQFLSAEEQERYDKIEDDIEKGKRPDVPLPKRFRIDGLCNICGRPHSFS